MSDRTRDKLKWKEAVELFPHRLHGGLQIKLQSDESESKDNGIEHQSTFLHLVKVKDLGYGIPPSPISLKDKV